MSKNYRYIAVWAVFLFIVGLVVSSPLAGVALIVMAAFAFAFILEPIVDFLAFPRIGKYKVPFGVPRALSSFLLPFGAVFSVLTIVTYSSVALLRDLPKLKSYIEESIMLYNSEWKPWLEEILGREMPLEINTDELMNKVSELIQSGPDWLPGVAGSAAMTISTIAYLIVLMIVLPLLTFYILNNWDKVLALHRTFWTQFLPDKWQEHIHGFLDDSGQSLRHLVQGQIMVCAGMATFYSTALTLIGLPLSVPIGILAGFLCVIPYAGVAIGVSMAALVAFLEFNFSNGFIYAALGVTFALGVLLEGKVLAPKIIGRKLRLHDAIIIISVLVGEQMAGIVGMLLALPMLAVSKVVAERFYTWWITKGRPEVADGTAKPNGESPPPEDGDDTPS